MHRSYIIKLYRKSMFKNSFLFRCFKVYILILPFEMHWIHLILAILHRTDEY